MANALNDKCIIYDDVVSLVLVASSPWPWDLCP